VTTHLQTFRLHRDRLCLHRDRLTSLGFGTPPRSLLCSSRSPARRFAPATIDLLCFAVFGPAPLSSQVSSSPSLALLFFLSSLAAPTLVFRDRTE
jgi:hypothetical protein